MGRLKPWDILGLLVFQLIGFSSSTGPPQRTGPASQLVTARVGTLIKLPCPVQANPDPFMEWFKDKDLINQGWERFRVTDKFLRIKDILREDAGHYVCKAINGFGSITINITLRVVDSSMSEKKHNFFPQKSHEGMSHSSAKPRFASLDKMLGRSTMYRPVGSSVRFKCKAVGNPHPNIIWFKDGLPLTSILKNITTKKNGWILKLHHLRKDHTGKYTCRVFNVEGSVNFTFTLEVIEKLTKKPEILAPHPMNITVGYGSIASFQCRVKSLVQPHIQWLKRVEEGDEELNLNATIEVEGYRFIVLDAGSVLHTSDGTYLNKLVIPSATEANAGMYICMGANTKGFSFREAFLFVSPDPNKHLLLPPSGSNSSGSSLSLVIAVPSLLVFLLIGGFIYLIQQRRRCCSSQSPAVRRFPVPTHDNYPAVHNPHMYPVGGQKAYSSVDYYTDISSASRSHPSQHQHQHYNY